MNQWFKTKCRDDQETPDFLCPKHALEHPFLKEDLEPVNDLYACLSKTCARCDKELGQWLSEQNFKQEAA